MKSRLIDVAGRHQVRVYEGGRGPQLLFMHGAGGLLANDPFLARLEQKYTVTHRCCPVTKTPTAPNHLRTMLDFTLFGLDVWEALKLKDPILVGHSMGGMIAAEMAAISNTTVEQLALICPAGLWLDDDPIPDLFAKLPFELPPLLFHDPAKYSVAAVGRRRLQRSGVSNGVSGRQRAAHGHGRQDPVSDSGSGSGGASVPYPRAHAAHLGRVGPADSAELRPAFRRRHRRREADDDRRGRAHGAVRADRRGAGRHREAAQLSRRFE